MTELHITVYGTAKPQPRGKPYNRGSHAGVYDPGTAAGWKALVLQQARATPGFPDSPLEGPLRIQTRFFLRRPKRLCRKRDPHGPIPHGPIPHGVKPDRDNLDKAVLDALKQAGLYTDDCQVCQGPPEKWYCERGGVPRAEIVVEPARSWPG